MSLLKVDDSFFTEATNVIITERTRSGEKDLDSAQILAVVKSYVQLGLEKAIVDWSYTLSDTDKDTICQSVVNRTRKDYGFIPAYTRVWTNLDIIETQSMLGNINPIIAKPRAAQNDWEDKENYSHSSGAGTASDTSLSAAISRVFGGIGQSVNSALKGLGLNMNIVLIGAAVIAVILIKRK